MSEQESEQEFPKVVSDESDRDTETGVESTRTVLVEVVPTWGVDRGGRQATFRWDDERETYVLDEYEGARKKVGGWRTKNLTFKQKDVDVLRFIDDHLRDATRGSVDVELFVGNDE